MRKIHVKTIFEKMFGLQSHIYLTTSDNTPSHNHSWLFHIAMPLLHVIITGASLSEGNIKPLPAFLSVCWLLISSPCQAGRSTGDAPSFSIYSNE